MAVELVEDVLFQSGDDSTVLRTGAVCKAEAFGPLVVRAASAMMRASCLPCLAAANQGVACAHAAPLTTMAIGLVQAATDSAACLQASEAQAPT